MRSRGNDGQGCSHAGGPRLRPLQRKHDMKTTAEERLRNKKDSDLKTREKTTRCQFCSEGKKTKKITSGAMRCMREINVGQSIGSGCAGSQVVIDSRLPLILTPLINISTFMQARPGSEVKGEEWRPWSKVKRWSCASASSLRRLQGKQPRRRRRRFDTVLSQQMDRNEIVMWGSSGANRSRASRVGQA